MAQSDSLSIPLSCTANALDKSLWKDSGSRGDWAVIPVALRFYNGTAARALADERSKSALATLSVMARRPSCVAPPKEAWRISPAPPIKRPTRGAERSFLQIGWQKGNLQLH